MGTKKAQRVPTDRAGSPPASEDREPPDETRVTQLEAKYRDLFRDMGKEGEAVGLNQLGEVVARGLAKEGYVAQDTEVGDVISLVEEMIDSREEGDTIVVRFRVNGRDIESFKVGR